MDSGKSCRCQFSVFVIFSVYEQGKTKNEKQKGESGRYFPFLFPFSGKEKENGNFSFSVFCFSSFSLFLEMNSTTLKMNTETPKQKKKTHLPFCVFHRAKMGK